MKIHLWFPNIFEFKGGIQVYSAFLLQALQNLGPAHQYRVLLKHDTRTVGEVLLSTNTRYSFAGRASLRWRTISYALQLVWFGFWERPNLIIASHANFGVLAAKIHKFLGIPYWIIAHGTEVWDIQNRALTSSLVQADRILCVSGYTRDRLLAEAQLDPQKVGLLPNTFDAQAFQPAPKSPQLLERYGIKASQSILLTVARLDASQAYKGYDQILRALPQIRAAIPQVHYLIVGKGSDRPRVEALIQELELTDCVTLAGFVPDAELCAHYNLCDVFAMPSQGEGFGIVYLEALACGKPSLGGNQDGAIDALKNGELGVLVNPTDVNQIAQALIQLLDCTYPQRSLFEPDYLRTAVIASYGFIAFKEAVRSHLASFDRHDYI
ncbi:MAG: glycosyltransferase family 4 protein [Spirulina sp. SIO3F2]|nr:glycosyltransferase family 4 protein [Spirulina sp. SIO3F2]